MLTRDGGVSAPALRTGVRTDSRFKVQWLTPLAPAVLRHHGNISTGDTGGGVWCCLKATVDLDAAEREGSAHPLFKNARDGSTEVTQKVLVTGTEQEFLTCSHLL